MKHNQLVKDANTRRVWGMPLRRINVLRLNLGPFQSQASQLVRALIIASHSYIITEQLHKLTN